ncbi:hypothetical protein V6N12_062512 [Hibiscus sabdariffa]|uniref:Uncharacterized protein n=1 Tax=Hibiscus sabdariffa TaxID=183260 RepID=A0ABR2F947_9ROSI
MALQRWPGLAPLTGWLRPANQPSLRPALMNDGGRRPLLKSKVKDTVGGHGRLSRWLLAAACTQGPWVQLITGCCLVDLGVG